MVDTCVLRSRRVPCIVEFITMTLTTGNFYIYLLAVHIVSKQSKIFSPWPLVKRALVNRWLLIISFSIFSFLGPLTENQLIGRSSQMLDSDWSNYGLGSHLALPYLSVYSYWEMTHRHIKVTLC